ncbi:thiamine-phosphate kinase [Methylobacterium gnaphalii]|uniref:Thiamine-monophosphate kinase n=1 Tax=Methylobacterium gnaphalii TaxID=1010610 RepID=A0A512JJV6_9HYPH|nr:thiamine-phosphate kinase [Methylobacterium gnaphalii]GEP10245.1 thiamine-monophosphate kinase [Methylobacterium gnaphalii]GJD68601.1 Thiamine-monophosphate kinase [Methylobacterium gnaphalii]GLS48762.1 thiamine-monophosphate kinase [Methylobacterium gnaphalii]
MTADRPGEEALIARYFAPLAGPGAEGLRDDAASLTPSPGHDLVVTVDAVVAGIHYFPGDPPASIARKVLGVNLSDLAAKGANPRGFLLTLALPGDWTEDWLANFVEGLREASAAFGCPLLGGDTVRSGGPMLLSVTAFGEVPMGAMVRRQGAQPGDRLYVTGTIGDAALGLVLQGAGAPSLDPESRAVLIDRYRHPQPRLALAPALRRHARAAMDVSDGLAGDLAKMLGGRITARVRIADVPLSAAARQALRIDPSLLATALTGGDDYEVLCAVPPEGSDAFLAEAREAGVAIAEIGTVEAGEGPALFLRQDGNVQPFERASFSHF